MSAIRMRRTALIAVLLAGLGVSPSLAQSPAPSPVPRSPSPAPSPVPGSPSPAPPPVRGSPTSGLQPGEDVMPFTSNVVTGPYRGMQHCFVCDARSGQACMVAFLRRSDPAAARFVASFRRALLKSAHPPLAWFVFLTDAGSAAEAALEGRVEELAARAGLTLLNLTVLGDPEGPPGYRVAPDAVLTVQIFRHFKIRYSRVWPPDPWSEATAEAAAREILDLLTRAATDPDPTAAPEQPGPPPGWSPAPGLPPR